MNGSHPKDDGPRPHPQVSFSETSIDPTSFFGKLRKLYSEQVLKTQLDQLKNQGSYDAFKLGWHPAYEVRRLHGGKMRVSLRCGLRRSLTVSIPFLLEWRLTDRRMESHLVFSGNQTLGNGMSPLSPISVLPPIPETSGTRADMQDRSGMLLPSLPRWLSIETRRSVQILNPRIGRYD